MNSSTRNAYRISIAAGFLCLLVYIRALSGEFVNWDDPLYIVENPAIRILDWQFFREALTTSYMGWWMPLTWMSFALDYHLWGLNPFGYRLTNILLHAANTGLVVLIADRLLRVERRGMSVEESAEEINSSLDSHCSSCFILLLAGLLWGIHPLRVESVAWVTERKDVLNGLFSLGTLLCYLRFAELKDVEGRKRDAVRSYTFSLVLLLFSLMSKPVSVVIPVMLLVLDWYPLNRLRKENISSILLEKLPFLILVASVSLATIQFAAGNQILVSYRDFPLIDRILLAGNSLYEYCRLSLYPVDIIHIYLLPRSLPLSYTLKTIVVLAFTCICIGKIKKMPWLFATWLLFVLPLMPVLGFFQNGAQSHAARFTYLPAVMPSICAAVIAVATFRKSAALSHRHSGALFLCLITAVLLFYAAITERLIGSWKNSETLWSRVIAIQPIGRAYYLRADYYVQHGRFDEAASDLLTSITMGQKAGYPETFNLHALRGDALNRARRHTEAVQEFSKAISLYPHPTYYYHRGLALRALGQRSEAEADFVMAGGETGSIEWQKR